jgi:Right handed beta helix region
MVREILALLGAGVLLQPVLWAMPHARLEDGLRADARVSPVVLDVRNKHYGARCDWDGRRGTDDTAAFEAAAAAASASYKGTGKPVEVRIGPSCEVASTVTFGSGVHWIGPGTVYVPRQTKEIFRARNADEVSVFGITIEVLAEDCGPNNATCSAIRWESTKDDTQAHRHVSIRNNTIHHANWGILIGYAAGTGSLSDVEIAGNVISSPSPYMDADAIHVGGRVQHFKIVNNTVFNRGDAGVAASSEVGGYICSDGSIEDNVLIEDQVGLDNSGCTNTLWKGNFVRATTAPRGSNPAFRSITYLGLKSSNITVLGNYFQNGTGFGEYAAKVDETAGRSPTNAFFWGNTMAASLSLYLRGAFIEAAGNLFPTNNSTLTIDYDGKQAIATDSISIGRNRWLGAGAIRAGGNPGLLTRLSVAPQFTAVPLSYTGGAMSALGESKMTTKVASELRGETSRSDAQRLAAGSCFSATAQVRGAVPSMTVVVTDTGLNPWPKEFVTWAFVSSRDVVIVRTCAVQAGVLPSVTFRVLAQ